MKCIACSYQKEIHIHKQPCFVSSSSVGIMPNVAAVLNSKSVLVHA
jgi:hypothetical protein